LQVGQTRAQLAPGIVVWHTQPDPNGDSTLLEIDASSLTGESLPVKKFAAPSFEPQMAFSDFESWAYVYARHHRLPVVSIDNQQVIDRCRHPRDVTDGRCRGVPRVREHLGAQAQRVRA